MLAVTTMSASEPIVNDLLYVPLTSASAQPADHAGYLAVMFALQLVTPLFATKITPEVGNGKSSLTLGVDRRVGHVERAVGFNTISLCPRNVYP